MKLKKTMAACVLALSAALMFGGCGDSSGGGGGKVVYLNYKDGDTFGDMIRDSFAAKAQSAGMNVEFLNAKGDGNLQIDQLNAVIADGASAIVLLPVDGTSIVPTVEKANAAGIPIVSPHRDLNGGKFVAAFSDDREAGRMQGEYMAKNLPPGAKVVYLMGESTQKGAIKRWEGFKEACLDKRPDVQLLSKVDAKWSKAQGMKSLTLWMKLFPQIDGVIAANDNMALGAIQALKDAGRLQGVLISGVDATEAGLKAVQAGEMVQTVKQDAKGKAEGAFSLLEASLKGTPPTEGVQVPFTSITKENITQFVK